MHEMFNFIQYCEPFGQSVAISIFFAYAYFIRSIFKIFIGASTLAV